MHYGKPKTPTKPQALFRTDQGTAKYNRNYGPARPRHLDRWVVTRPNRKWHANIYVYSDRVAAHMDTHTRANPQTDIDLTPHRDADLKIAVTYRVCNCSAILEFMVAPSSAFQRGRNHHRRLPKASRGAEEIFQ